MEYKTDAGFIRRGNKSDQWLVNESLKDRWMADVASSIRHIHELYVFVDKSGEAVGYVVPRPEPDGSWRTGAIYMTPKVRSFSSIKKYTGSFFSHKKALDFGVDVQFGEAA